MAPTQAWPAIAEFCSDHEIPRSTSTGRAGSPSDPIGAKNGARAILALIETGKLNRLAFEAWLRNLLARIADHSVNPIGEPLPWNQNPDDEHSTTPEAA